MGSWGKAFAAFMLVSGLFVLPSVQSGSTAEPEIVDPAGDGATHRDIVKVWFGQPDEGNVSVDMQLAAAPAGGQTTLYALHERWNIWFVPTAGLPAGMNAAYVTFTIGVGTTSNTGNYGVTARLGFTPTIGTYGALTAEIALAGATLSGTSVKVSVPLAHLKGFVAGVDGLSKLYANVVLTARGPTATDNTLNQILHVYDRAPNSGNGKDFPTVGLGPAGPTFALSGPSEPIVVPQDGNVSAQLVLSNGGAADVNITLSADNATEGYAVAFEATTVLATAGSNTTVNVSVSATVGAGNTTNLTVLATDDLGNTVNATLVIEVVAPVPMPTSSDAGAGNATQNATGAAKGEADEASGIPGFEALGLAAVAAIVIARRRRA